MTVNNSEPLCHHQQVASTLKTMLANRAVPPCVECVREENARLRAGALAEAEANAAPQPEPVEHPDPLVQMLSNAVGPHRANRNPRQRFALNEDIRNVARSLGMGTYTDNEGN